MKKIGLAICFRHLNYGTVLQAFATQQILFRLGFNNECVDYRKPKSFSFFFSYLHTLFIPFVLQMKFQALKKKFLEKRSNVDLQNGFSARHQVFAKFIAKNFTVTESVLSYKQLKENASEYSALLVGSDQIWHPLNLGSHFYTLEWGTKDQPRIAYAPSFGVSKIPAIQKKWTARYLNKFSSLSCRERAGVNIIKSLIGKEAQLVLDPTLLHTAEEWNEMLHQPKCIIKQPYIFCYFLGNNPEQRDFVNQLKEKTGLKIVFLPHLDEIILSDMNFGDYQLFDVGPADFFSLIKNAEYVCTDSFHGTVFSILNKKKFATFNRYRQTKGSTNSRIDSLLALLKLETQRMTADEPVESLIHSNIDYESVHNRLAIYRKQSIDYLNTALNEALYA